MSVWLLFVAPVPMWRRVGRRYANKPNAPPGYFTMSIPTAIRADPVERGVIDDPKFEHGKPDWCRNFADRRMRQPDDASIEEFFKKNNHETGD